MRDSLGHGDASGDGSRLRTRSLSGAWTSIHTYPTPAPTLASLTRNYLTLNRLLRRVIPSRAGRRPARISPSRRQRPGHADRPAPGAPVWCPGAAPPRGPESSLTPARRGIASNCGPAVRPAKRAPCHQPTRRPPCRRRHGERPGRQSARLAPSSRAPPCNDPRPASRPTQDPPPCLNRPGFSGDSAVSRSSLRSSWISARSSFRLARNTSL